MRFIALSSAALPAGSMDSGLDLPNPNKALLWSVNCSIGFASDTSGFGAIDVFAAARLSGSHLKSSVRGSELVSLAGRTRSVFATGRTGVVPQIRSAALVHEAVDSKRPPHSTLYVLTPSPASIE
jgi:hypothetical protein